MRAAYLEAGKVVGTHGVRGELRVEPWCDSPDFLKQFSTLYWKKDLRPAVVESARVHKHLVLLKLQGVDSVEAADALRGQVLCFQREDAAPLPEGRYYWQDLLGLSVFDEETGVLRGKLTDIFATGANDVYEVTDAQGKKTLVPAVPAVVSRISLDEEAVYLKPLGGLFDAD